MTRAPPKVHLFEFGHYIYSNVNITVDIKCLSLMMSYDLLQQFSWMPDLYPMREDC